MNYKKMKQINANIFEFLKREFQKPVTFLPMIWEIKYWYKSDGKQLSSILPYTEKGSGEGLMGLSQSIHGEDALETFEIPDKCTVYTNSNKDYIFNIIQLETDKIKPVYAELINLHPKEWVAQDILFHYEKNSDGIWFSNYLLSQKPKGDKISYSPFSLTEKVNALDEFLISVENLSEKSLPYAPALKKVIDKIKHVQYQQKK